jgi:hypothetical protein
MTVLGRNRSEKNRRSSEMFGWPESISADRGCQADLRLASSGFVNLLAGFLLTLLPAGGNIAAG